ncbi:SUMF1/EgtB/PvdO family nonheme iron enzyme, partial [Acidobacteriota bacterium]
EVATRMEDESREAEPVPIEEEPLKTVEVRHEPEMPPSQDKTKAQEAELPRQAPEPVRTPEPLKVPEPQTSGQAKTKTGQAPALKLDPNPARWPKTITWPGDGSSMRLIKGGTFTMGARYFPNERPEASVYVRPFYMDSREITNLQYEAFEPSYVRSPKSGCDNCPVVGISWSKAQAYAEWAGKRLPTEAEWEKAARGGMKDRPYPWGNAPPMQKAKYNAPGAGPAGSYAPNGFGLFDMSGNVWEWCRDWYEEKPGRKAGMKNPAGPSSGTQRVIRGGGWDPRGVQENRQRLHLTTSVRQGADPAKGFHDVGFRCIVTKEDIKKISNP